MQCIYQIVMLTPPHFCYLVITGEKKLGTVITPDTWKDGARNTTGIFPFRTQKLNQILPVNNVLAFTLFVKCC